MRNIKSAVAAASAFVFLSFAGIANANLITNGGFESGDFTGWTQTGNTTFNGVNCPGPGTSVTEGNCAAFFGPVGSLGGISQLAAVAAQSYLVQFDFQPDGGNPSSFAASFGGVSLLSLSNPSASAYTPYSFNVVAISTAPLSFDFRDDPGFLFLDNVRVTAVPAPATLVLLGLGLAGLGWSRRRKA